MLLYCVTNEYRLYQRPSLEGYRKLIDAIPMSVGPESNYDLVFAIEASDTLDLPENDPDDIFIHFVKFNRSVPETFEQIQWVANASQAFRKYCLQVPFTSPLDGLITPLSKVLYYAVKEGEDVSAFWRSTEQDPHRDIVLSFSDSILNRPSEAARSVTEIAIDWMVRIWEQQSVPESTKSLKNKAREVLNNKLTSIVLKNTLKFGAPLPHQFVG